MRQPPHTPPRSPRRVTPSSDDRESELKLFTLWNQGVPPPFATLDDSGVETKSLCRATCNPERWWVVVLTALEVVRITDQPLRPLSRGELTRNPLAIPSSRLRARLGWGRAGQGHHIDVDIGAGVRLAIEGSELDVTVVGPRGHMRETTKGDVRTLGQPGIGGLYVDTLVSAHIVPSGSVPSARCPVLTQVFTASPGISERSVTIPPFARRLTVSRSGTDGQGPLSFRVGVTGPAVREVVLEPVDPGSTRTVLVPQAATHITTGPAEAVPRVMTFQWELDL